MIIASVCVVIVAVVLLVLGLRGDLVNNHPHCRACGFDLDGLGLGPDARCPECGRSLRTPGRSVRLGLRRRRRKALALGVLLALAGGAGLSYPLWSQMPAWKNIDWYEHLPKPMLISLSTKGNSSALSELHARMIRDSLSETGLNQLLASALSQVDDESQEWHEQWGDVIVWCMLTNRMTHEQVGLLAEATMYAEIRARPVIRASDESIAYTLGVYGEQRGAAVSYLRFVLDARIANDWERLSGRKNPWSIEVSAEQVWIDTPPRIAMIGAWMNLSEWVPVDESYFERAVLARIPEGSEGSIVLNSNARFTLKHEGSEVHSWDQALTTAAELSQDAVQYAEPLSDPVDIGQYISTLTAGFVAYPRNRMLGRLIEGTKDCHFARSIRIHAFEKPLDSSVSALFDLFIRVDEEEILFSSLFGGADMALDFERGWSESRNMLDYFDEHAALWARAEQHGHVNLILRPNPGLAALDPRITQYIDAAIIFRDVPLMILEAKDTGRPSPAGTTWRWVEVPRRSYPSIPGELLLVEEE